MRAKRFLYDKISLNVLAKDIDQAKEIYQITEGHVLIALLAANYQTIKEAVQEMKAFHQVIDGAISVGLGAGDPNQTDRVIEILQSYIPEHVNQTFTKVKESRKILHQTKTWVNALVQPAEDPTFVNIATGPESLTGKRQFVPIETAIQRVRKMGGNSLKFFPMNGLETKEQYERVAKVCARENLPLEPTGGITITLDNFYEIVDIALKAGVPKVIPHVYSSIVEEETGKTNLLAVKMLYEQMKELARKYKK